MHEFNPREPDNLSCTECSKGRYHENHRTPQNIAYAKIMGMVGGMIDVRDVRRREIQEILNELYDAAVAQERRESQPGAMTRDQAVLYLKGLGERRTDGQR